MPTITADMSPQLSFGEFELPQFDASEVQRAMALSALTVAPAVRSYELDSNPDASGLDASFVPPAESGSQTAASNKRGLRGAVVAASLTALLLSGCKGIDMAEQVDCTTVHEYDSHDVKFNPPGQLKVHTRDSTKDLGWFEYETVATRGNKPESYVFHSDTQKGNYTLVTTGPINGIRVIQHPDGRPEVTCP